MTQSQAFETRLAIHTDSFNLRGKFFEIFNVAAAGGVVPVTILNAVNLGARCATLNTVFARYRFKYIRFKFFANNTCAIGVLDDASVSEGDGPTTLAGVAELRCSATQFVGTSIAGEFMWTPIDKKKWYYTSAGVTGSDIRLEDTGALFAAMTAVGSGEVEIDYSIVFSGALDTSST